MGGVDLRRKNSLTRLSKVSSLHPWLTHRHGGCGPSLRGGERGACGNERQARDAQEQLTGRHGVGNAIFGKKVFNAPSRRPCSARLQALMFVVVVSAIGIPVYSMPIVREDDAVNVGRRLLGEYAGGGIVWSGIEGSSFSNNGLAAAQEPEFARKLRSRRKDDGVPTKLLIGVLVPVGVLLIVVAAAIYRYSNIFRRSRDVDKRSAQDNAEVSADGGVIAEMGFHDQIGGGFHDANGGKTADKAPFAGVAAAKEKLVTMDGSTVEGGGLGQKAMKPEKGSEKKRGSKIAHPGIGLGSVFGEKDESEKNSEGEGEGGGREEDGEEDRGPKKARGQRRAERVEAEEVRLELEGEGVEGGRAGSGSKGPPVGEGDAADFDPPPTPPQRKQQRKQQQQQQQQGGGDAGEFEGSFGGITAVGTQPVQVWQDAPFAAASDPARSPDTPEPPAPAPRLGSGVAWGADSLAVPAGPAPIASSSSSSFVPRALPALPTSAQNSAPLPLPAPPRLTPPRPAMAAPVLMGGLGRAGEERRLAELLRRQQIAFPAPTHPLPAPAAPRLVVQPPRHPAEPNSPPPMAQQPTMSVAGLYSRAAPGAGAGGGRGRSAAPMLIDGTGQLMAGSVPPQHSPPAYGARAGSVPPQLPPSFYGARFTPEASPGAPAPRYARSPGPQRPPGGGGVVGSLAPRDPRRRRIMNLHKEMFGGSSDPEGMTKPVELPGDKGISYYQGRSSLAGRMAYASIERAGSGLPKAPFVPPGGMRDEDEMWG